MTLNELIKSLQSKPDQNREIHCAIWTAKEGNLICANLAGPATKDIMRALAKHAPKV